MTTDETSIWLFIVTVAVFTLYLLHLIFSVRYWRQQRTASAFMTMYIAAMIQAGMTSILFVRAARTWPSATWIVDAAVWVAPVLTWFLLTGAIVALWAWRTPSRRL